MSRVISSLMLIMLGFAVVPSEIWHECAAQHTQHDYDTDEHEEESCGICDFDFAEILPVTSVALSNCAFISVPARLDNASDPLLIDEALRFYRGPPLCSDHKA
jgi:hypothetical protein